jgi:hypothetical protein
MKRREGSKEGRKEGRRIPSYRNCVVSVLWDLINCE